MSSVLLSVGRAFRIGIIREDVVCIFESRFFKFAESGNRNVKKVLERRQLQRLTSKVGYDSESGHWAIEQRAVEFREEVRTSSVSRDNNERTCVSWTHFAIKGLFDCCVSK